jgi:hypothetical protein
VSEVPYQTFSNPPGYPDPYTFAWNPNSITIAGDYLFLDYWQPHYNLIFNIKDGSYVGRFEPGKNVGGLGKMSEAHLVGGVGNTDLWTANSAFRRKNGEYVLFQEEDYQAKLLMYRWTPPNPLPPPPVAPFPKQVKAIGSDQASAFHG